MREKRENFAPRNYQLTKLPDTIRTPSLAEPSLLIERENRPGTYAVQELCSLQPTVQTNQIVEFFYVMISAYYTNR